MVDMLSSPHPFYVSHRIKSNQINSNRIIRKKYTVKFVRKRIHTRTYPWVYVRVCMGNREKNWKFVQLVHSLIVICMEQVYNKIMKLWRGIFVPFHIIWTTYANKHTMWIHWVPHNKASDCLLKYRRTENRKTTEKRQTKLNEKTTTTTTI